MLIRLRKFECVDILVNNAAAIFFNREETVQNLEKNFGLNYLAPFLLTTLLLDHIKKSKEGRIINLASFAHAFHGGSYGKI